MESDGLIGVVRDVMTSDVKTARPDDTLRGIVQKMAEFHIGSIVVVQEKQPVGIITERDVLVQLSKEMTDLDVTRAEDLMSSPVLTIGESETVEEASQFMTENHIKKLPVTRENTLVGIVTSTDVMRSAARLTDLYEEMAWIWRRDTSA